VCSHPSQHIGVARGPVPSGRARLYDRNRVGADMDETATSRTAAAGYVGRLGRDTLIYVGGTSAVLVFGFVQVAVLTHFLDPSIYGTLGLYLVFASFLTIFYSLWTVTGTLMLVFGAAGDVDDGGDGGDVVDDSARDLSLTRGGRQRLLTTGVMLTVAAGIVGTGVLWLTASTVGHALVGDAYTRTALMLAGLSGASGAVWRLVTNVPRLERRPLAFAVLHNLRPTLVLGLSIPLVATGHGLDGALLGTTLGTAAAVVVAVAVSRRSYSLRFGLADIRSLVTRGAPSIVKRANFYVPVVVSHWIVHNGDVFFLSRFASHADVGLYRLAGRFSALSSYFVGGFMMSQPPLERSSLFKGTYARHGEPAVKGLVVRYYVVLGLALVLALSLAADALIRLAPASYHSAAPLIPVIAFGLLCYGGFTVLVRAAQIPNKRRAYPVLSMLAAVTFIVAAPALISVLGAYGAALAIIVAMTPAIGVYAFLVLRVTDHMPFHLRAMTLALVSAAGCLAFGIIVAPLAGPAAPAVDAAAFIAYPVLMLATGAVPRAHLEPALVLARRLVVRTGSRTEVITRLEKLDPATEATLELALRHKLTPAEVAEAAGVERQAVCKRLTAGASELADVPEPPQPVRVAEYLLHQGAQFERDDEAKWLWENGVDALDLHHLEVAVARLRKLPRRAWRASGREARVRDAATETRTEARTPAERLA
jgi:O-antigen/teichoic acid export membrane protein